MALNIDIRPPTPDMKGNELHQWQQRIFEALQSVIEVNGGEVEAIDHDNLLHNGGVGSHNSIALSLARNSEEISQHEHLSEAHGTASNVVGISDEQALTNKIIDADKNTLLNLKHGEEVDNPTSAHGVTGEIVGNTDEQTLTNKTIDGDSNTLSNLKHGEEVDNPPSAHGTSSDIVGINDEQTLTNKTIDGLHNTLKNLKHGKEVDNPNVGVHGVAGFVVGTYNAQVLLNKRISENVYSVNADYLASEYDTVIQVTNAATITLYYAGVMKGIKVRIDNLHTSDITVIPKVITETIEGEISQKVPPNSCMAVQSDGTKWRII